MMSGLILRDDPYMRVRYFTPERTERHMVRLQQRYYTTDEGLRDGKKTAHVRAVVDPSVMFFGYQLKVATGPGMDIQKCNGKFVLKHDMGWGFPGSDLAKNAIGGHGQSL
jgi:hypothetical protein